MATRKAKPEGAVGAETTTPQVDEKPTDAFVAVAVATLQALVRVEGSDAATQDVVAHARSAVKALD